MGLLQRSGGRQWLGGNELVAEDSSSEALRKRRYFSVPRYSKSRFGGLLGGGASQWASCNGVRGSEGGERPTTTVSNAR